MECPISAAYRKVCVLLRSICPYFPSLLTCYCNADTYKNCEWYGCSDSCLSSKVLITQRTEIYSITEEGNCSVCSSGINKLCSDPPNGANSPPVDLKSLFTYPDEDDVSYYYNVQAISNENCKFLLMLFCHIRPAITNNSTSDE